MRIELVREMERGKEENEFVPGRGVVCTGGTSRSRRL